VANSNLVENDRGLDTLVLHREQGLEDVLEVGNRRGCVVGLALVRSRQLAPRETTPPVIIGRDDGGRVTDRPVRRRTENATYQSPVRVLRKARRFGMSLANGGWGTLSTSTVRAKVCKGFVEEASFST
jgi:hypothetical protein